MNQYLSACSALTAVKNIVVEGGAIDAGKTTGHRRHMKRKEAPIPDFDAMTPEQRLRCHFAVWESMDRHGECESAVPDRHAEVVNERVAEYKTGNVKMMTIEEAKAALGVRHSDEEVSDWEEELVRERIRAVKAGETELMTFEEFAKRLRQARE